MADHGTSSLFARKTNEDSLFQSSQHSMIQFPIMIGSASGAILFERSDHVPGSMDDKKITPFWSVGEEGVCVYHYGMGGWIKQSEQLHLYYVVLNPVSLPWEIRCCKDKDQI